MNKKQSLKAASKHIEELEHYNFLCKRDIKAYNKVIEILIAGGNPCPWCDVQEDCAPICQGHGCKEWVLKFDLTDEEVDGSANRSETVSAGGGESGKADEIITGTTGSLQ